MALRKYFVSLYQKKQRRSFVYRIEWGPLRGGLSVAGISKRCQQVGKDYLFESPTIGEKKGINRVPVIGGKRGLALIFSDNCYPNMEQPKKSFFFF